METAEAVKLGIQLAAALAQVVTALEANAVKAKEVGLESMARIQSDIAQLHADTLDLTTRIDALH